MAVAGTYLHDRVDSAIIEAQRTGQTAHFDFGGKDFRVSLKDDGNGMHTVFVNGEDCGSFKPFDYRAGKKIAYRMSCFGLL